MGPGAAGGADPATLHALGPKDGREGAGGSVLHGHGALAVWQVHHDEALGVRLGGDAGLAAEKVEGRPGGDGLLEAAQAAATVGQHEVVEGVGLEVRDELLGGPAVHVQREPIVLDLWAGTSSGAASQSRCSVPPLLDPRFKNQVSPLMLSAHHEPSCLLIRSPSLGPNPSLNLHPR